MPEKSLDSMSIQAFFLIGIVYCLLQTNLELQSGREILASIMMGIEIDPVLPQRITGSHVHVIHSNRQYTAIRLHFIVGCRFLTLHTSLICDFCPSDQTFVAGFLQISPRDEYPCP